MRKTIQRLVATTALAGGLVVALSGAANASIVSVSECPAGYKGVVVGSDATGAVFVCENIV